MAWSVVIEPRYMLHTINIRLWLSVRCLALVALAYGGSEQVWSNVHTTPSEVVERWLMNYPHNLETAAALTTLAMRHFKQPDEWSQQMRSAFLEVKLKYLEHTILTQDIQGKRAVVTVEAFISTIAGNQFQKEEYVLLQVKGQWLINTVTVTDERFLGKVM